MQSDQGSQALRMENFLHASRSPAPTPAIKVPVRQSNFAVVTALWPEDIMLVNCTPYHLGLGILDRAASVFDPEQAETRDHCAGNHIGACCLAPGEVLFTD